MLTQTEKPCIIIWQTEGTSATLVRSVCAGIEEERIPYAVSSVPGGAAAVLAFAAAAASRLEIGVAITPQEAAVSYAKMPPEQPLFRIPHERYSGNRLHILGVNAARLMKGIPFKEE